ncbi:MAG: hypothetical protein JWO19_5914 [Bryobacterales bacterium]|nr:hypothetical protein [Bryobacterales bacterium]
MTVENAPDALGGSVKGLITLRKRLQRLHGNHYTFSRTSGDQADTAYEAFKRGAELSKTDFIATIRVHGDADAVLHGEPILAGVKNRNFAGTIVNHCEMCRNSLFVRHLRSLGQGR